MIKTFEFLFKLNEEKQWCYNNFIRMTDRSISEQKEEIKELLTYGFDKIILQIAGKNLDKNRDVAVIYFELKEELNIQKTKLNMQDIQNIKTGYF